MNSKLKILACGKEEKFYMFEERVCAFLNALRKNPAPFQTVKATWLPSNEFVCIVVIEWTEGI